MHTRRSFLTAAALSATALVPGTSFARDPDAVSYADWGDFETSWTAVRAGGKTWALAPVWPWETARQRGRCPNLDIRPHGDATTGLGWWQTDICGLREPFAPAVWNPRPGEDVRIVGVTMDVGRFEVPAMVAAVPDPWPTPVILSAPPAPGTPGGAVLDSGGRLVGVVLRTLAFAKLGAIGPYVEVARVVGPDGTVPPPAPKVPTLGIAFAPGPNGAMLVNAVAPPALGTVEPGDVLRALRFATPDGIAELTVEAANADRVRRALAKFAKGRPVGLAITRGEARIDVEVRPVPAFASPAWI